jgi:putative transposase
MRIAHSAFGRRLNTLLKRTGAVMNSRPSTSLIEDEAHAMKAHFYVEANPIRARICTPENLRQHPYSSFRFYAYGVKDSGTKMLTPPSWYIALGQTPEERQRRYRTLFYKYLRDTQVLSEPEALWMQNPFIGGIDWIRLNENRVRSLSNQSTPPPG